MINVNDSQYELKDIKIFNNGVAGIVNNVTMSITKKTAQDADNAPAYKLILKNDTGEINKGYFNNFDNSSESALQFFVKEMKHLAGLVGIELPSSVASYNELLDITMKSVKDNIGDKLFNVFVSYGTKERPNKYLQIASAFSITKNTERPYANPKAQMERIEPTVIEESKENDPLGFNSPDDKW